MRDFQSSFVARLFFFVCEDEDDDYLICLEVLSPKSSIPKLADHLRNLALLSLKSASSRRRYPVLRARLGTGEKVRCKLHRLFYTVNYW